MTNLQVLGLPENQNRCFLGFKSLACPSRAIVCVSQHLMEGVEMTRSDFAIEQFRPQHFGGAKDRSGYYWDFVRRL